MNHSVPSIPWEIDVISAHTSLRCLNELKNLFFFLIGVQLFYSVLLLLYNKGNQLYVYIYTPFPSSSFFFFGFISLLCHHRALSRFPCPVQQVLISNLYICVCVCVLVAKLHPTPYTSQTVADRAPLSMGFSRQEYCSGLPCYAPGDLPNP